MFTKALDPLADIALDSVEKLNLPGPERSRTASPVPKINIGALSSPLKLRKVPTSQDMVFSDNSRSYSQQRAADRISETDNIRLGRRSSDVRDSHLFSTNK